MKKYEVFKKKKDCRVYSKPKWDSGTSCISRQRSRTIWYRADGSCSYCIAIIS